VPTVESGSEVRDDGDVAWLGWLGIGLEFLGVVLVGAPDLVPGVRRATVWLAEHGERGIWRVLRVVGVRRPHYVSTGVAAEYDIAFRSAGLVHATSATTLEDKVAFLLRRDEATQGALQELNDRVVELERETERRLDAEREETEAFVGEALAAQDARYRWARILGAVLLIAGLVCTAVATL
jgi:hypothetical protein